MSHDDRIAALLAEAEPLRALEDDDPRKEALQPLIAEVNRLRAEQDEAAKRGEIEEPKRGPGRPRKDAA